MIQPPVMRPLLDAPVRGSLPVVAREPVGFRLGSALGKIASGIVRQATGGLVRPNFQQPTRQTTVGPGGIIFKSQTFAPQPLQPYGGGGGGGGGGQAMVVAGAGCPTGFRLNKSTYVSRGGGTSRWPVGLRVHPKGSECVRRRKINAGNGRAATRAVRRLVAFYGMANRVAKQLRRAASKAKLGRGRRGQRQLPRGGSVQVIDTD